MVASTGVITDSNIIISLKRLELHLHSYWKINGTLTFYAPLCCIYAQKFIVVFLTHFWEEERRKILSWKGLAILFSFCRGLRMISFDIPNKANFNLH